MGCCSSDARAGRPTRVNLPFRTSSEFHEEETKNPINYRKPSEDFSTQKVPVGAPLDSKLEQNITEPDLRTPQLMSRKQSEFNLNKDLIASLIKERIRSPNANFELQKSYADMEVSTFKITEEQHATIYKFVEERRKVVHDDIMRLYNHFLMYTFESEELPVIIEELKTNYKDVENCLDDLKAHPIPDEKSFYYSLERDHLLIREITREYRTFKKNNYTYEEFREAVLGILRRYHAHKNEEKISENGSGHTVDGQSKSDMRARLKDTAATTLVAEENHGSRDLGESSIDKTDREEANARQINSNITWVSSKKNSADNNQDKGRFESQDTAYGRQGNEEEELEEIYRKLAAELKSLKLEENKLTEKITQMHEEKQTVKNGLGTSNQSKNEASMVEQSQKISSLKQLLVRENEKIKSQYEGLKTEFINLQKKFDGNNKQKMEDCKGKVKEIEYLIQQRSHDTSELEKTGYLQLSDLMSNNFNMRKASFNGKFDLDDEDLDVLESIEVSVSEARSPVTIDGRNKRNYYEEEGHTNLPRTELFSAKRKASVPSNRLASIPNNKRKASLASGKIIKRAL